MTRPVDPSRRNHLLAAALTPLATALSPRAAIAQSVDSWPSRPIRILVGFPPGGLIDAYARMYGEQLAARVGQPVTVENRPGAGAIIALDALAKSAPDGHTLGMSTSSAVLQNRVLYRKLPYDADRELTPVSLFPSGPLVVAVNVDVAPRSLRELIDWARTRRIAMGTYGPATYAHLVADTLDRGHGTRIDAIHYKGEAPMWIDLASGQVQVAIGSFQGYQSVAKKERVRPIAVTGTYRSPNLPEVPTLAEAGLSDRIASLDAWGPLLAPAGTPEPVLKRLADIAVEGARTPRAVQLRAAYGIPNTPTSLEETRQRWQRDGPVWIELARELGITLD